MTGAGSASPLVFAHEGEFANSVVGGDPPDLFGFGKDHELTDLSLENQLETLREGDEVWATESVKQNFEGAVGISATISTDVHPEVEKIVFNDGGTNITSGLSSSARIYTGVNYPSGTAERELYGCIPTEYAIEYEQGGMLTYSLSMLYADEQPDPTVDLTGATRASEDTALPWHAMTLNLDGVQVEDLQSMTLSLSELARFQYGDSPTPNRGVIAAPSASLEIEATFTSPSRMEIARGNATGSLPDDVAGVPGTIEIADPADGTLSTYNLENVAPDSYTWNQVVGTDDTTDSLTANVTGEDAVSIA